MFGNSKISFASGGKEAKSLASLSIEKIFKPTYFDKIGNAHTHNDEFKPSVSNFKMSKASD